MPKSFQESEKITEMAQSVMEKYHPKLTELGVTVHVLVALAEDRSGEQIVALKKNGCPVAALIKVTSLEDRARGIPDVKIVVDDLAWNRTPEGSREALLDHELEHLVIVRDNLDVPKKDDLDRPRLRLKPHDWELTGFLAVAERHREAAVEVRAIRSFKAEQMELFG